jgi:hypothetical protein
MACGDVVVDKHGLFVDEISSISRKVIGLDMESYAALRTAALFEEVGVKCFIAKGVMDFTQEKSGSSESDKALASFVSARFVFYFALEHFSEALI